MDIQLLLEIANREMPRQASQLLMLASYQLALAETALELHRESSEGYATANLASPGVASVSGLSSAFAHVKARNVEEVMAFTAVMLRPSRRSELGARSFIYELAVLRRAAVAICELTPQPAEAGTLLDRFDTACPMLVKVRDSLAHLDERFLGVARGTAISVQPAIISGETLDPGVSVAPGSLSAHLADGSFGRVEVSGAVCEAAKLLLTGLARQFPLKPNAPGILRRPEYPDSSGQRG